MTRIRRAPPRCDNRESAPFGSAEEAWFWSMAAWLARREGARVTGGLSQVPRPCEPSEVMMLGARLARQGRLDDRQWRVLLHYGRLFLAPDPRDPRHATVRRLWEEGMRILEGALKAKGILA